MARIPAGINGPVLGKVGSVIGSSRRGVPYLKGPYKKRTKKVSKKEMANRKKFADAQAWLQPLLPFVREGFKGYNERSEGFVAAKSWLLKNAFEGDADNRHINPAMVVLSFGNLPLPVNLSADILASGDLQFTWDPTIPIGAHPRDQVMMVAYDMENMVCFFSTTGQFRAAGIDTLTISTETGSTYHVYAAFTAADRSRQSQSVYLGTHKR